MTMTQPAPAGGITASAGLSFKQAVGTRRSIRSFRPYQPVEKDKVQKVLEDARLQSQHGNAVQTRKAVVVYRDETDPEIFNGRVNVLGEIVCVAGRPEDLATQGKQFVRAAAR